MPTYNPNDFYPRTGQEIKTDGTTVNEADGIDANGNQGVNVVGSNKSIVYGKYDTTINIAASNGGTVLITPPIKQLWRLKQIKLTMPTQTGAASGAYQVFIGINTPDGIVSSLDATANFNTGASLVDGLWSNATSSAPGTSANHTAFTSIVASNSYPLSVYVYNATNAVITGTLTLRAVFETETTTA